MRKHFYDEERFSFSKPLALKRKSNGAASENKQESNACQLEPNVNDNVCGA